MYIPKAFEMEDKVQLLNFIRQHSFGILFSQMNGSPFATHLPFLVEETGDGIWLLAHMAKANPHWQGIQGEVLIVFQGPHAYISPVWYESENTVPTWNYTAVHVYGDFIQIENPQEVRDLMEKTVGFYETEMPNPWKISRNDETFTQNLIHGIIGFKVRVNKIEGKWKLSQNQPKERKKNLAAHLRESSDPGARAIAALIEKNIPN